MVSLGHLVSLWTNPIAVILRFTCKVRCTEIGGSNPFTCWHAYGGCSSLYYSHIDCKNQMFCADLIVAPFIKGQIQQTFNRLVYKYALYSYHEYFEIKIMSKLSLQEFFPTPTPSHTLISKYPQYESSSYYITIHHIKPPVHTY